MRTPKNSKHPSMRVKKAEMECPEFDMEEQGKKKRLPAMPKDLTLFTALKWIYKTSENSALSNDYMKKARRATEFVAKKLGVTPRQAALVSILIVECTTSNYCCSRDIGMHLDCNPFDLIEYMNDFADLITKRLARRSGNGMGDKAFVATQELKQAVNTNADYTPVPLTGLDTDRLITEIMDVLDQLEDVNDRTALLASVEEIKNLLKLNPELEASKQILGIDFAVPEEFIAFVYLCCMHYTWNTDEISLNRGNLSSLIGRREYDMLSRRLLSGNCKLITDGLVESVCEDGMMGSTYCVKADVRKKILGMEIGSKVSSKLIQPEKIVPHKLFFRPDEEKQMARIRRMLSTDNFGDICEKLKASGMRRGICICLSGGPGTGKTESVLQIARETGRQIMKVDVSAVRDKYVGESEKRCARVFDTYADLVYHTDVCPILFLNECDQLLSRRMENVSSSVDQMSNSIQNIILEKMEQLEGILICTTNLVTNLDPAFERRFLIKQELGSPSADVRASIWKSMIPALTENEAFELASDYELSGGQIENVARRVVIASALDTDGESLLEQCRDYCTREKFGPASKTTHLGF